MSWDEEWRDVAGCVGYYQVSNLGRVRSLDRVLVTKAGWSKRVAGQVLNPKLAKTGGYPVVGLSRDDNQWTAKVHRLVALAFLGDGQPGREVCHNDGNPQHNAVSNLRWGTRAENVADAVRHGTAIWVKRTTAPCGHEYDGQNSSGRICVPCRREMVNVA